MPARNTRSERFAPPPPAAPGVAPHPLDPARFARALAALRRCDPRLARLLRRVGTPPFVRRRPGFATLVRIILEQQVSLASAAAVFRRLEGCVDPLTPSHLAATGDVALRRAGLSGPRIDRLRALSEACLDGAIDLRALARAPDDAVRRRLMAVRGIGPWTADVYLMFALRRPDVWPGGDLALAIATQRLLNLARRPDPRRMDVIGERWSPWRTVAAHALWHASRTDAGPATRVSRAGRARRRSRAGR